MEKVLEVNGLTKQYKNGRGVNDISFCVRKGEIFGLLGPNGSGKTTTMKVITGLCRADKGDVRIFGYDICENFEKAMSRVGCIIETCEAYSYMSAYKNLQMVARFYTGIDSSRIDKVLELTGLYRFRHEKVDKFSLGMKQRLGLAAAILSKPELVILDEPANGLDIEGMVDIRKIITSLAREQDIAFLVSSHLVHEMELTCDRVGIIDRGKLVKVGDVKQILDSHTSLENFFIEQVKGERRPA